MCWRGFPPRPGPAGQSGGVHAVGRVALVVRMRIVARNVREILEIEVRHGQPDGHGTLLGKGDLPRFGDDGIVGIVGEGQSACADQLAVVDSVGLVVEAHGVVVASIDREVLRVRSVAEQRAVRGLDGEGVGCFAEVVAGDREGEAGNRQRAGDREVDRRDASCFQLSVDLLRNGGDPVAVLVVGDEAARCR